MSFTPANPSSDEYYQHYRRSLIERHIAKNGRFIAELWLLESPLQPVELFHDAARRSVEGGAEVYVGKPFLVPEYVKRATLRDHDPNWYQRPGSEIRYLLAGGGDNPLLYGGLAMAVLSMEAIHGLHFHSFSQAQRLFDFFLNSEGIDQKNQGTGVLLRKRNYWHETEFASLDELCGVLLGVYFFVLACKKNQSDADAESYESAARKFIQRIAAYMQAHEYQTVGAGSKWIFQWPFGRIFQALTDDDYESGNTAPGPDGVYGALGWLLSVGAFDWNNLDLGDLFDFNYKPKDLYCDLLKRLPGWYKAVGAASRVGLNVEISFFNMTMFAYSILMVLLPDRTHLDRKREVAQLGIRFLGAFLEMGDDFGGDYLRLDDAKNNVFFAVVARLCLEYIPDGQSYPGAPSFPKAEWLSHLEEIYAPLLDPASKWHRDLPLAAVNGTDAIPFEGTDLWGETFTWCHVWPHHSFTSGAHWWDTDKARRELGLSFASISNPDQGDHAYAEDLSRIYGPNTAIDTTRFRIEAAGLDFLFPRMLLAHLGFCPLPLVDSAPVWNMQVEGPTPDGLLLFNLSSDKRELHRMDRLRGQCNYALMKEENKLRCRNMEEVPKGYDFCAWCIGESLR